MRVLAAIAALVVLAGVTACGGDGDDAGSGGTRSKRAIETEAQQRAESTLLLLSDFPDGWRASTPDPDNEKDQEKTRQCMGIDTSDLTIVGEADSKDFKESSAEASSSSAVYENAAQAEEAMDAYAEGFESAAGEDCLRAAIEEDLSTDEAELDEVDIGELNVANSPDVEQMRAWQVELSFTVKSGDAEGFTPSAYIDLIQLREGESLVQLETYDVLSAFDSELRNTLLERLADRMTSEGEPSQ